MVRSNKFLYNDKIISLVIENTLYRQSFTFKSYKKIYICKIEMARFFLFNKKDYKAELTLSQYNKEIDTLHVKK